MCAHLHSNQPVLREGYAPVEDGELFYREVGHGQPIIFLGVLYTIQEIDIHGAGYCRDALFSLSAVPA
jgi:hypothetical protein